MTIPVFGGFSIFDFQLTPLSSSATDAVSPDEEIAKILGSGFDILKALTGKSVGLDTA